MKLQLDVGLLIGALTDAADEDLMAWPTTVAEALVTDEDNDDPLSAGSIAHRRQLNQQRMALMSLATNVHRELEKRGWLA